jgi:hypothetical protein
MRIKEQVNEKRSTESTHMYADSRLVFLHFCHFISVHISLHLRMFRGRRGRDRMVVENITTYAISTYHH